VIVFSAGMLGFLSCLPLSLAIIIFCLLTSNTVAVGLLCAYIALLRGASRVHSIDRVARKLAEAKSIDVIN